MPASSFRDPFVDAGLAPSATALVLALDHELVSQMRPPDLQRAREQAWARVLTIDGDGARFSADPSHFDGWLGLLVLDGFALCDEAAAQAPRPELLGPGDVIPPWALRSDPRRLDQAPKASLEGIGPVRIALLDRDFARRIRPWPQLGCALLDRAVRRSILRAVQRDIRAMPASAEVRARRLLLHAAARWGTAIADGHVQLPRPVVSQRMIGAVLDLTPSASADALDSLLAGEQLRRDPAGGWLVPVQA